MQHPEPLFLKTISILLTTRIKLTNKHKIEVDLSDTKEYLQASADDLNLYFTDTFLLFEDTNQWEHVDQFVLPTNGGLFIKTNNVEARPLKNAKIKFVFPETGLYNFKKGVISYKRKSLRQNKKGFCANTADMMNITSVFGKLYSLPYGFILSQTWKWIPSYVNTVFLASKYPDMEEAYTKVRRLQDFARAITKDFFIGQGITSRDPSLWFRQTLIGKCSDKHQIVIENPVFLQEVIDQFIPMGINIEESTT